MQTNIYQDTHTGGWVAEFRHVGDRGWTVSVCTASVPMQSRRSRSALIDRAMTMNDKQLKALRLISSGGRGLTELGNVLVSRQAEDLLCAGLIDYAQCRMGYRLTAAGRAAIA